MPSSSRPAPPLERARPLLGTLVRISVELEDDAQARHAVEAAFAEIARVHRLMTFHEADSDLGRLNRAAPGLAVEVDTRTAEVLQTALAFARQSDGAFDPTVGAEAVAAGALPRPADSDAADPVADWHDVHIEGCAVRLRRKAWLDLGGIAKGYAVDRAIGVLQGHGAQRACVDAGGDLRVLGTDHAVRLRVDGSPQLPLLLIDDGAVASSGGDPSLQTPHFHAARRASLPAAHFASVTAPSCMVADAMTKIVLALGLDAARPLLQQHRAAAYAFSPRHGWRATTAIA